MIGNYTNNLKMSLAGMGILSMCLRDFAAQIISHFTKGSAHDGPSFDKAKAIFIRNLKEVGGRGISLGQEAELLNQALLELKKITGHAITLGRNPEY